MVSIMPGMENFAPERTLTSSGLSAPPSFWPLQLLQALQRFVHLAVDFAGDACDASCTRGRLRSGW